MRDSIRRMHDDEEGMSALQVVMILAIAAVVLGVIKLAWNPVKNWFLKNIADVRTFGE